MTCREQCAGAAPSPRAMTTRSDGLQVIGGGLMRTGTMSLQTALQRLLGAPCYHMRDVLERPEHVRFWLDATQRDPSDAEWRAFFRGYGAAVDIPAVAFYRRLLEVFPDAKVVLSVRDPRHWFRSVRETIWRENERSQRLPWRVVAWLGPYRDFVPMVRAVSARLLGPCAPDDEEAMVAAFVRHVEAVKSAVPAERLLVFEAGDGWAPLCRFLDVPEPPEAFPHVNSVDEFRARVVRMRRAQLGLLSAAVLALGVAAYFGHRLAVARGWMVPGFPSLLPGGEL